MKRIHIPNLYWIQGQAHQGKSTLMRFFRTSLNTEVIPTDVLFWRWCDRYHPQETRQARQSLGRYFPYLSSTLRHEWFEYMTNHFLRIAKYARPDAVAEGWLLTKVPKELQEVLRHRFNIMDITMRHYSAIVGRHTFRPDGRDYTPVVDELRKYMKRLKEKELLPRAKHQRFEDCKHSEGQIDCKAHFEALNLPVDLRNKTVLDLSCGAGYYSTRMRMRGANVYAVDGHEGNARLASRIANAVYAFPDIRFYFGNVMTEDFRLPVLFDYIVGLSIVNGTKEPAIVFDRMRRLLKPGGVFVAEVLMPIPSSENLVNELVPSFRVIQQPDGPLYCPNEKTLLGASSGLAVSWQGETLSPSNKLLTRRVYHFCA